MNMWKTVWNGITKENPVFSLYLGLVPAIGITHLAWNGVYLGLLTMVIFLAVVLVKSLVRDVVVKDAHVVLDLTLMAIFTTIAYRLLSIYWPGVVVQLSIFLPLIAVNGFVLQRLGTTQKSGLFIFDAIGMGIGFTLALTLVGSIREFLGLGKIFGITVLSGDTSLFSLAATVPGGMIIFGLVLACMNALTGKGGELSE